MVQQCAAVLLGIFATAANRVSVRACVRMRACHPEHDKGQFQPTLPLNFKSIRAVQQRYSTSEPRKAHIHRNACVPPFQLATPPGFQVNHIPKGNLVCMYIYINALVLRIGKLFFSGSGRLLALLAAGRARGARVHYGASLGPGRAPWRVLWEFKVASWPFFTRSLLFATPRRPGPWKPHNFSYSLCCCCITRSLQHSSSLPCGSHGTTAVAHQALPFVTATDGAYVYVCAMIHAQRNRNEHMILNNAVQFLG